MRQIDVTLDSTDQPKRYGRCDMLREAGIWIVRHIDWSSQRPALRQASADGPEVVYRKLHKTVLERFNPPAVMEFFSATSKAQLEADGTSLAMNLGRLHRGGRPREYVVVSRSESGSATTLNMQGNGTDAFGRTASVTGQAVLVNEGGWKVHRGSGERPMFPEAALLSAWPAL